MISFIYSETKKNIFRDDPRDEMKRRLTESPTVYADRVFRETHVPIALDRARQRLALDRPKN